MVGTLPTFRFLKYKTVTYTENYTKNHDNKHIFPLATLKEVHVDLTNAFLVEIRQTKRKCLQRKREVHTRTNFQDPYRKYILNSTPQALSISSCIIHCIS